MEVKEVERVVIAKPVASKPAHSSFSSFSELLAGAMNASPSPANTYSEMAVTAIRPKTVRVKPTINNKPLSKILQAEDYGKAVCSFDSVSELGKQATVVFKPVAKVVSRRTVSLLANLGSPRITHQQEPLCIQNACAPHSNQNKLLDISNPCPCNPTQGKLSQSIDPPKMAQQMQDEEPKTVASSSVNVDRPSYDGYNWRKYGQKHVKGSEYPRSYYKCTHPNCLVKKKVERSFDGQITEIVYEGEHNHPKPQPTKRSSSGAQGQGLASGGTTQDHETNDPKSHNIYSKNGGPGGRTVNQSGTELLDPSTSSASALVCHDLPKMKEPKTCVGSAEDSAGPSGDNKERNKGLEDHDDKLKSKRRKYSDQNNELGTLGVIQEHHITVQNNTESETAGDGFRWRKYGQKVVKGNAYPRSYYRCTSPKCNVRKHVERASDDPNAFITTYEGRHNHEKPMPTSNSSASPEPESVKNTAENLN